MYFRRLQHLFLTLFLLPALPGLVEAATIKGKVRDAKTGELLIGATVLLKGSNVSAITDLEGEFRFKDLSPGTYMLTATYVGYEAASEKSVVLSDGQNKVEVDFSLREMTSNLTEVEVTGQLDRETDLSARRSEKLAPNVVNIVSARAIEISPDITVANVAQRISGVTLVRNGLGDGQYAIIRGIDPRYNNTLINGVKIPSPDPTNRFIPLDIIPAELLQRMEVTKALTPDMEGDAIGGTINAVMKEAPSTTVLSLNASTGYSQLLLDRKFSYFNQGSINFQDPNQQHGGTYYASQDDFNRKNLVFTPKQAPLNALFGATFGRRFLNNKLGIIVSGTNQNTYRSANSVQNVTVTSARNQPTPTNIISRDYYTQQNRTGLNVKVDYLFSPKHQISAYGLYLKMNDIQSRYITDTIFNDPGRYGPGSGKVSVQQRSRYQIQTVESVNLQGKHALTSRLAVDWSAVYSNAIYQVPDMAEVSTYHTVKPNGEFDGASDYLSNVTHTWQKSQDRDYTGYLNATYQLALNTHPVVLKVGGLYRAKDRSNYQNDYNLLPTLVKDSRGIPQNPPYTGIDSAAVYPYQPVGNPQYNTSNYTATESITAAYAQGKTEFGRLQVLAGARLEITSQSNRNLTPAFPGFRAHYFDYHDLLPSLHLNYRLTDRQNLRASVFKSISRPNYYELVDYTVKGDQFNTVGNPNLKHVRATSYDVRYEWYLNGEDVIQAGVFYKHIEDPIEILLQANGGQPQFKPINTGTANNYGFELVVIKYVGNFGVSANYTFTNSTIASPKLIYYSSSGTSADSSGYVNEKRPLQGQSRHVGNASLLYRNPKMGFNCQLALVYQGKRIAQVSQYYALDFYQTHYTDLSFSAEKKLMDKFVVFCKLNNLLNTPYRLTTKEGYLYQQDTYRQNYLLGVRYRL